MKILITIFILFFSPSVFAKDLIIDCFSELSFKIDNKGNGFISSELTDYQWIESEFKVITNASKYKIISGEWGPENQAPMWNRIRIPLYTGGKTVIEFYKKDDGNVNKHRQQCTYYYE